MKKIISCLFILLIMATCSSCFRNYSHWQTLDINKYGTIKIPPNWSLVEQEGKLYLSDKSSELDNKTVYFFESDSVAGIEEGEEGKVESNILCNKFQNIICTEYHMLSNEAEYGKCTVLVDGEKKNKLYFMIYADDSNFLQFISWNDNIDYDTLIKIAKSYTMYV